MLTRVTITGADDAVNQNDLRSLSARFPFVEWGILYSRKRLGEPRYPTDRWRHFLPAMRMSLHLCGAAARNVLDGSGLGLNDFCHKFWRIQVNGYTPPSASLVEIANTWVAFDWILQVRDEASLQAADDAKRIHGRRGSILFDPSGGRGLETFRWPPPLPNVPMGYAGGIKPENVLTVLRDIGPVDAPFWIDMESGVRTDDRFDLAKVWAVLEACEPYVTAESR